MHVKTSRDVRGRTHNYGAGNAMYLNGFFDWNSDGDFQDPGEHAIGTGAGVAVNAAGAFNFQVTPPPNTPCAFNSRFRLDWREDVGQVLQIDGTLNREHGAAQHGEVEDYPAIPRLHWHNEYCHPLHRIPVSFPGVGVKLSLLNLCHPPQPFPISTATATKFQPAGKDCMNTALCFQVDGNDDGVADEDLCLTGPVCVLRGDPYVDSADSRNTIDTQMVSLDMTGFSHFAGTLEIHLAPQTVSPGQIKQSKAAADLGIDVSGDTPAASFFDVSWIVKSELLGISEAVGPTRVEANISAVPPGETISETPPPPPPPVFVNKP